MVFVIFQDSAPYKKMFSYCRFLKRSNFVLWLMLLDLQYIQRLCQSLMDDLSENLACRFALSSVFLAPGICPLSHVSKYVCYYTRYFCFICFKQCVSKTKKCSHSFIHSTVFNFYVIRGWIKVALLYMVLPYMWNTENRDKFLGAILC